MTAVKSEGDEAGDAASDHSQDTIPPQNRDDAVERDGHRCRACGARGPGAGGMASLQVHHIEDDPEHCDYHDLDNLTTLCEGCHDWVHKQPSEEDVPIELSDADKMHLRPHDYEILRYLHDAGPAMVSSVTDALTFDVSEVAIRERLWLLMGLDEMVQSRENQLIDRDAETGEWGVPEQITQSERGRIPGDIQLLIQRIEDEWVRQALERGCDRDMIAEVLDVHPRTTWHKERRAYAVDFPLDQLSNGDDSALIVERRPRSEVDADSAEASQDKPDIDDGQQRFGEIGSNGEGEDSPPSAMKSGASGDTDREGQSPSDATAEQDGTSDVVQEKKAGIAEIQTAITALKELQGRLS